MIFTHSDRNNAHLSEDYFYRSYGLPSYLNFEPAQYTTIETTPEEPSGLDAILSSKKDLIIDRLAMIETAMKERKNIQADVLKSLQSDQTIIQNQLFRIEPLYDPKLNTDWEKRKLDLEREERQHQTSYFNDLSMIQKELRDTIIDYMKEKQMEELFK